MAFADAIRQLVSSPQRRADAGRQARVLVEQRFGVDSVLGRFEQQLLALTSK